jgi:hypothetical protein
VSAANRDQYKRVAMAPLRPPSVIVDDGIPVTTIPPTAEVQTRPNRMVTQPPAFTDEEQAFFAAGDDLDQ